MRPATQLFCLPLALASLPYDCAHSQAPITIENPRPLWKPGEELHLGTKPTLIVGTQNGEMYALSRIAGTARLSGGDIVVADGGSSTLRFFNAQGVFVKSVGGRGAGPGDFQNLRVFFVLPGDTLVAGGQTGQAELSYFTSSGQYLRRLAVRGVLTGPPTDTRVAMAALDGIGTRLVGAFPMRAPRNDAGRWTDSFTVSIINPKNETVRTIGVMPSIEVAGRGNDQNQIWFGATMTFAGDSRKIYLGFGSEYIIREYSAQGVLQRIIRRAWTPTKVTRADFESFVTAWGKRWITSTGSEAEAERNSMRNSPYAVTLPAFAQLLPDRVGRLWVREAHAADAAWSGSLNGTPLVPSTWSVFDTGGRWLGDVTMPAGFLPRDIGADYVLGTQLVDDIDTVVMYRLGTGRMP